MRKLRAILLVSFTILLTVGCHRDRVEKDCRIYDFGVVRYPASPFVGVLENHPLILEKSLDYAPYKWCVSKEHYGKEREFQVGFNTGAFLDSAESKVLFCNNDGVLFSDKTLQVLINGVDQKVVSPLSALVPSQKILVGLFVNPELQDTVLRGRIAFTTQNLDKINEHQLVSNPSILDAWTIQQKKPCYFWLYFLWIVTLLLLLAILALLLGLVLTLLKYGLEGLMNFISWVFSTIGGAFVKIGKLITYIFEMIFRPFRFKRKRSNKKKEEKKKDNKIGTTTNPNQLPRILLVSDYVYTDDKNIRKADVMKESLSSYLGYVEDGKSYEGHYRMYQNIEGMFKGGKMTKAEKKRFWACEDVEHFAYVFRPMIGSEKPSMAAYKESVKEFREFIEDYAPDYIVIMGRMLYNKLVNVDALSEIKCKILKTNSASFPFFDRSHEHDYLKKEVNGHLNNYYE